MELNHGYTTRMNDCLNVLFKHSSEMFFFYYVFY